MSGLVLWAGRDGRPPDREDARAVAAAASYRASTATREVCSGSAIALHLDGGEEGSPGVSSPLLAPDASLLVAADARIDNRVDIAVRLGRPDLAAQRDDPALVLEAYRRWGDAFADRMAGDFAIAVWDASRRRLLAARDMFAMRPLFFRVDPNRVVVASDVRQILAARDVTARVFEPMLAAHLARSPGHPRWSFYAGVERVPPGHTIVVDEGRARVRRHAPLEPEAPWEAGPDESAERLRAALAGAVLAHLGAAAGPGLLLSGGLDSLSIAGAAGLLIRDGRVARSLRTYSFAFSELKDEDERAISGMVAQHYGLPSTPVPADTAWPLAEHPAHGTDRDTPDRLRSHVVLDRAIAVARREGVTTIVSGHRGDALQGGQVVDYLGCLSQQGVAAWWRTVTEHSRRTGIPRRALIDRHLLRRLPGAVWPHGRARGLRRAALAVVGGHEWRLPPWLRRDALDRLGRGDILGDEAPRSALPGEARRRRHDAILDAHDARSAEALERLFARAGIRYTDPWADRGLAELVLSVPQYVITPAGEPKRLLREAMRGVLPEEARLAARKRLPDPLYLRGLAGRGSDVVGSLIAGSRVAALGLVDERVLHETYARFVAAPHRVTERQWRWLWCFVNAEDWLRRSFD